MLLTPFIKHQLRIFAVLATVALGMMVFVYARVPSMAGIGVYDVKAEFGDSSGLYPKALVTYRGVKVGQVSDLQLTDTSAVATLRLRNGTKIPATAFAELHSTSAVGEQYVDLVPRGPDGDELKGGDVIPRARTVEMPQITPVLDSVNHLLETVPQAQTTRVLDEVDAGLGGSGPEVGELIDSTDKLITEAQRQVGATTGLINALEPVLTQQEQLAPRTYEYASSLRKLTHELATRDTDLRTLLRNGRTGLEPVDATVNDLQTSLPMMLDNLTTNATVLNTYLPQLEQTLVVYPATVARLQSSVNPRAKEGDVQLDLRAGANDPPSCSQGYLTTRQRRSPSDPAVRDVDKLAHCAVAPADSPSIRGARNLPCPTGSARGPLPAQCGYEFGSGRWPDGVNRGSAPAKAKTGPAQTGSAQGSSRTAPEADDGWRSLVLGPLGLW